MLVALPSHRYLLELISPTLLGNESFPSCNILNGRAMAQAVSRRPLSGAAMVRDRVSPCGFYGRQVARRQAYLRVFRFSLSI
jgi:hypothetical protein